MAFLKKKKDLKTELFVLVQKVFFPQNSDPQKSGIYTFDKTDDNTVTATFKVSADFDSSSASQELLSAYKDVFPSTKEPTVISSVTVKIRKEAQSLCIKTADFGFELSERFAKIFNQEESKILEVLSERLLDYHKLREHACNAFALSCPDITFKIIPNDALALRVLINSFNVYLGDIDISNLDDLTYAFAVYNNNQVQANKRTDFDGLEKWDTSHVKKMLGTFAGCVKFNHDISMWDTSNVTNMDVMFASCSKFNQDISSFDTSKVESMKGMFYKCESFNQDISSWNTSKVKDMSYAFYKARAFDQDLSSWNTESLKNDENMFLECNIDAAKHPHLPSEDIKLNYYNKYIKGKTKEQRKADFKKKLAVILCFIIVILVFGMMNQPQA